MNLAQIIQYITNVAKEHPLVKTVIEGDVYQLNSLEVKYGVFCITQPMNNVIKDDNIKKYTFTIFYVDRLTEDESNKLVIQTDGINTIHEVFNYITTNAQTVDVSIPITFTTFTEKFADKCAGAYANITVEVDDETGDCDFYYEDILVEPIPGTSHTTVLDNYYTKVEVEDLIADAIADVEAGVMTNYYTKNQSDNKYETIENVANLLANKADKSNTLSGYGIINAYTKTEVDIKFDNTRTYKIENVLVSTWSASSAYVGYPFETRINIADLKESDSVEVIYNIIDAGSAKYAPGGELHEGYIKLFAKINTTITIPTLVVTKINL